MANLYAYKRILNRRQFFNKVYKIHIDLYIYDLFTFFCSYIHYIYIYIYKCNTLF